MNGDRPVIFEQPYLTRKSERQLLMYSMDKRVRFSVLLLTLVSQKDYFRLPHGITHTLLIT